MCTGAETAADIVHTAFPCQRVAVGVAKKRLAAQSTEVEQGRLFDLGREVGQPKTVDELFGEPAELGYPGRLASDDIPRVAVRRGVEVANDFWPADAARP